MAVSSPFNRVKVVTSTTGTGTVTLSSAETGYAGFSEAGVTDGSVVTYLIEEGNDFEIGQGTYTASGTTLSRDAVRLSKISGTAGTSKMNLAGAAKVSIVDAAEDMSARSPIGKQTLYIPASAMLAATTSGPAPAQFETTTNDINFKVLDFDASADEHAHFNVAFPKNWNEGTVTFQVFWMSSATDTDGVAWGLQGVAISDNESTDASWGTAVVVTDDAQSNASELYVTSESSAVTIAGTPAAGDACFFRVFRDVSDANDDMTEDARLIGVKLFYTTDAATDA